MAASAQCAAQPEPSHTPCNSATACVVGNRYATPRSHAGSSDRGKKSPENASIGYRITAPSGCANRAVGTRLASTKPSVRMLSVPSSSAAVKLTRFTSMAPGNTRRPASTSSARLTTVKRSFTNTCALRIVAGESGVARKRLRIPPSR